MKKIAFYTIACFLFLFTSCHDDDENNVDLAEKTVIVYMAAENNLEDIAYECINKMERAISNNDLNLIVYLDTKDDTPQLLKIRKDNSDDINSETIEVYEEQNTSDPNTLNSILKQAMKMYPAKSYGLILWSHATAWLPTSSETKVSTRSFGLDGKSRMDIMDMAEAIPNNFDYIIFDCCLMGSIEVAYELKDKTPYILAAPTEILAEGLPYDKVVPFLFDNTTTVTRLTNVAKTFYEYYNAKDGGFQTAATSLIKTSEVGNLATLTKELLSANPLTKWEYNYDKIQKLDNRHSSGFKTPILFDFEDFLDKNFEASKLTAIKTQINKTVLYKAHTARFIDDYDINSFCGLSCYVPRKDNKFNSYYKTLSWTSASDFLTLME